LPEELIGRIEGSVEIDKRESILGSARLVKMTLIFVMPGYCRTFQGLKREGIKARRI
jgi:hypothetical protein